jgi:hypothetical protein
MPEYFLVQCRVQRGAFSQERIFEVDLEDGGMLVGAANLAHLRDATGQALGDTVPDYDDEIDGFVECRKIENVGTDKAIVEFASSDVCQVRAARLQPIKVVAEFC